MSLVHRMISVSRNSISLRVDKNKAEINSALFLEYIVQADIYTWAITILNLDITL